MAIFKCKMCGGDLEIIEGAAVAECDYCGTKQTVPKAINENMQSLFNRANTLRIKSEFDKAEKIYEKIIQAEPTQAEAYWGLILCKYGIEYVDDPETLKKVPTCHRASYDSIIADDDYKSAIRHADMSQRVIYEEQAREIDRIQKEILALAQKEETYDVFICYKETDADGQRTQDSAIANDIYYQLTQEGFKVFYSAITLEDKLGSAYEPIIFAALNSAKVMLAIGTRPEYFNAVWVKNEWSRFLKIIKKDRTKLLIPCYRDMDAYELPEEFAHLQAQDMAKIGFINDVVRGIKKVIKKQGTEATQAPKTEVKPVAPTAPAVNIAPLLKRAFMFLEDGDWSAADEYCEKVLDQDPENAQAYLGKAMIDLKVQTPKELSNCFDSFIENKNYKRARRLADDKLFDSLLKLEDEWRENAKHFSDRAERNSQLIKQFKTYRQRETINRELTEQITHLKNEKTELETLASQFPSLDQMYLTIQSNIVQKKNEANMLKQQKNTTSIFQRKTINENIKNNSTELEELQKALDNVVKKLKGFSNFEQITDGIFLISEKIDKLEAEQKQLFAFDEQELIRHLNADPIGRGLLDDYKAFCNSVKIGQYITFGTYMQNKGEIKEDIEWLVLDIVDNRALLVSKYALDAKPFHSGKTTIKNPIVWHNCTLRQWLNKEFIDAAFSDEEKWMISTVEVAADKNSRFKIDPGENTRDKMFILSVTEVKKYFNPYKSRFCQITDYAKSQGAFSGYNQTGWWWTRTPGGSLNSSAVVCERNRFYMPEDAILINGIFHYSVAGSVRPAMWIDLNG